MIGVYHNDAPEALRRKAAAWEVLCELASRGRVKLSFRDWCELDFATIEAPLSALHIESTDALSCVELAGLKVGFEPTLVERVSEETMHKVDAWNVFYELYMRGSASLAWKEVCRLSYHGARDARVWVTVQDTDPLACVQVASLQEGIYPDRRRHSENVRTVPDSEEGGL